MPGFGPGIHVFLFFGLSDVRSRGLKAWMPATSAGMTIEYEDAPRSDCWAYLPSGAPPGALTMSKLFLSPFHRVTTALEKSRPRCGVFSKS